MHIRGYGNGGMRVDVDFPAPQVMYLRRGWKTFKLMENGLLSVKVFGDLGTRVKCCVESSFDDEDSSSSESDEEDNDNNNEGVKREDVDSN